MSYNELVQKAIGMRSQALAPYSNYKVGAAVLTESGKIDIEKSVPYSATANVIDQIHAIGSDEQWTFYHTLEPGEIECGKINDSGIVKQINIVDMKPDRSKDAEQWTDIPLNYYCNLTTLGNDTLAGVYREYRVKVAEHFPSHPILSKID